MRMSTGLFSTDDRGATRMRFGMAAAAAAGTVLLTVLTAGVSTASQANPAPEYKVLYNTTDTETFKGLRIAGCLSDLDPTTGQVTVSVDALLDDQSPPSGCAVTPSPVPQDDGGDGPPVNEDLGEQVLGQFGPDEVPEGAVGMVCRYSGESRYALLVGLEDAAEPDHCAPITPGQKISLP